MVEEGLYGGGGELVVSGGSLMGEEGWKKEELEEDYFGGIGRGVGGFMKDLEME